MKSFTCFRDVCQLLPNSRFQWQSPPAKTKTVTTWKHWQPETRWWHAHLANYRFNAPQRGQRAWGDSGERTGFVAYVTCFINKQKAQKIGTKLPAHPLPKEGQKGPRCCRTHPRLRLTCPFPSWHWAPRKFSPALPSIGNLALLHTSW